MARKSIIELKKYFKIGKRPTENQFADLIDSYAHLDDQDIFSSNYKEKSFQVTFLDQQADRAVDILFGNDYVGGTLEVELVGTFNYTNSVGIIRKKFEIGANPDNYIWNNPISRVMEASGPIVDNIFIGNIIWDDAIKQYKLTIYHTALSGNPYEIRIKHHAYGGTMALNNAHLSDVYSNPLLGQRKHSVHYNDNLGIGTDNPQAKLDVRGSVLAGNRNGIEGVNGFALRYEDGSLNNWGALRSSSDSYMSYGVKADPANGLSWLSSSGSFPHYKTAITAGNEGIKFWASSYQQTPINSSVSLNELMTVNPNGNVGVGTSNPQSKLDVQGSITSQASNNEGGAVLLINKSKTTPDAARKWAIYNMTGTYGNSLQFWNYFDNGGYGVRLKLSDSGNMALYGKLEAKDVVITQSPSADFVFAPDYNLKPIQEVEKFISEKNHLPEIPSAKEITENGLAVGDFQIKLLQKIEELTLYMISQNKDIEKLKTQIN